MADKCPYCYRPFSTWKKNPILLPNGSKYKWSDIAETTLIEETDINKRLYKGFYQIEQDIKELQDAYKTLEEERLLIGNRTIFSPVFDEITGIYQVKGIHIKELRESAEKLLTAGGLTKIDYFNYDEDRNHIIRPEGDKLDWADVPITDNEWDKFQIKAIHIEELRHYIYSETLLTIYNPHSLIVDIGKESGSWTLTFSGSCEILGNPDTAIITLNNNDYPAVISPTIIQNDPLNFKIKLTILDGGQPFDKTVFIEGCSFKFLITKGEEEYSQIYNFGKFAFGFEYSVSYINLPDNEDFYDGIFTLKKSYRVGSFEIYNRIKNINSVYFNAENVLGIDWGYFLSGWTSYHDESYLYEWYAPIWGGWISHSMYNEDACLDNAGFWLRKQFSTHNEANNPPNSFSVVLVIEANYNTSNKYDFTLTINYSV